MPSAEAVELFFKAIAPGFVALYVRARFILAQRITIQERIPYYLIFSAIYFAAVFSITKASSFNEFEPLIAIFVVIIVPAGIGLVWGLLAQLRVPERAAHRLGVTIYDPRAPAWDFKFSGTQAPEFVHIVMKDGTECAGWYGEKSAASSDPNYRDIYIEETYMRGSGGDWERRASPMGIWISASEIRCIWFQSAPRKAMNEPDQ